MTSTTKARHRKATRPLTPLSDVAPSARLGLAVAASSGLALAMVGSGAAVAASNATEVGDSAGSLQAGVGALAAPAREALAVNEAVTVAADAQWQGVSATEVAAEPAPAPKVEPKVEETPAAAERAEEEQAPAARSQSSERSSEEAPRQQTQSQQAPAQDKGQAPASAAGSQVVAIAWQYVGVPYVYGGSSPAGFDCSGLVQYVYRQAGISLPRTSWAQGGSGRHVSAAEAQPGDIVYYGHHVGIYVGNGQMIHAPKPGDHVRLVSVYGSPSYVRVG